MLPEDEATYLAIVFEEVGKYQYKKNKEIEGQSGGEGAASVHPGQEKATGPGLRPGFEEDFRFGDNDDTDYWHFKDEGVQIVD